MKIVFLARYLPQEGSTTHMYTLAKGLIDREHEVHIISAGPKNEDGAINIYKEMIGYGMHHHTVKFPISPSFTLIGRIFQLFNYIISTPKVLKLLFEIVPNVIHVHYPVTSYNAKIYRILTGKKFVTTHHITGIPKHPLHRKADYVIAISRELESELYNKFKYSKNQIKLIFNGVSIKKFDKIINLKDKDITKENLGIPHNKIIIGFVGSLTYRKGIDILLHSVSKMNKDKFHLCLVGDGDIDWVKSIARQYQILENLTIFPFQDPVKFYLSFDIFVLPSRQEGFPLVPLEAMMMGVPTIRSNVEGANDQISHGVNGYIFENENAEELRNYLEILINDGEIRNSMGLKAKKNTLNNFTEDIMIEKLLNLYKLMNNN